MYGIFIRYPRYDNRDAVVGHGVERLHNNAYETLKCAVAMTPKGDGWRDETTCFVADLADPYRRPMPLRQPRLVVADDDDIPF